MLDDPKVASAIIAAFVSLVVSAASVWGTRYRAAFEERRRERELARKLTEKLYEQRIQAYRGAFSITQGLLGYVGRNEGFDRKAAQGIYAELSTWLANDGAFILSNRSLKSYYKLRDALLAEPNEQSLYTRDQRTLMWVAKNEFRRSLRRDVRLLFLEDGEEEAAVD